MENNDKPIDPDRLALNVKESFPCREEPTLFGDELLSAFERKILTAKIQEVLPPGEVFLQQLREFFTQMCCKHNESISNLSDKEWVQQSMGLSHSQLEKFLVDAARRFTKAFCEPGEAVGALCATSVGEPTTQMTLKVGNWIRHQLYLFLLFSLVSDIPL